MSRIRTWLIVSVILNVFLVGGIAGALHRWKGEEHAMLAQQHRNIRFAAQELGPQYRKAYAALLRQQQRNAAPYAKEARQGRQYVAQLLMAPQMDQQAIDLALTRIRSAEFEHRRELEESIVAFAAALPFDERILLVQGLQRRGSFQLPGAAPSAPPH
ncbi:MAG: periplasmic heavy metal sensor [Bordetella sp.]|uniref:periplasmic heavy metal sensor n=1 Tax=Bordetella sp. TaxID=28081 RepID=UPI003F7BED7E